MATGDAEKAVKAQRFTCKECGAEMKFDAGLGQLKCDHCGATREVPTGTGTVVEYDFFQGLELAPKGLAAGGATRAAKCQECGANVVFPDGVTATRCTFCGSNKVLEQAENQNAIRPESLVPFGVDKKRANQSFNDWLRKLWFRPSDLKRMAKVQEVAGVYVPFWTYDAHVESSWTAEAGYYYYETEEYTTQENGQEVIKERRVQRTRWERAWGHRADDYDDVLVCASVGLPRELADQLSSFDTQQLVAYSPGFLAGWRAEEYAVDLQQGFGFAQEKMEHEQGKRCGGDVPGDTQRFLRVDNTFSALTFKHVLLPVWIAAYRYRNKVYRFLVNGQTGEVVGKAPWSWIKITLFVLVLLATAILLYYFFGRKQ
jgi:DNA-directed RNA polymerase subunit RPC12/RpoP